MARAMAKFRKKPVVIEAVRYGKDTDGRWYSGSVQRVAAFMRGRDVDAHLTSGQIVDVVRPVGAFDPPELADVEIWVEKSQAWCKITPGDWVLAEADGVGFYPCTAEQFTATYEPAELGPDDESSRRAAIAELADDIDENTPPDKIVSTR